MKDHLLPILIFAVFVCVAIFILVSNENRSKAPSISAPQLPSQSMKASVFDLNNQPTPPAN